MYICIYLYIYSYCHRKLSSPKGIICCKSKCLPRFTQRNVRVGYSMRLETRIRYDRTPVFSLGPTSLVDPSQKEAQKVRPARWATTFHQKG